MEYHELAINFYELEEYIMTFLDIREICNYKLVDKHCYTVGQKILDNCLNSRNEFVKTVLESVPIPQWVQDHADEIKARDNKGGWFDEDFSIWGNLSTEEELNKMDISCRCCRKILFRDECEKTYVHNPYYLDHNCYVKKYSLYCRICFIASIALCYMKRGRFYNSFDGGYKLQNEFYAIRRNHTKLQNEVFSVSSPLKIAYELEDEKLQDEPLVKEIIKVINTQIAKNGTTITVYNDIRS
ncbi:Hypothetical protein PACV_427 [Pacmanvirus A23]|uniref:Hypothetical protein n=1 Tax=Pacmanvirus A23 TaxID=1932881 RepID=UPI000A0923EF|nr:Hypothetical protein B9W72_gp423 [Pacmanvirus A23]SIP86140.1 Hypothetical protein PACV_427 [Pacmanvirus A23]